MGIMLAINISLGICAIYTLGRTTKLLIEMNTLAKKLNATLKETEDDY